jgi:aldose 1-epimerase
MRHVSADLIMLAAGDSRVRIVPRTGGAIASYEWCGQHVLRNTPDEALAASAVRRFGCYPLVPFSNRIADATLHWGGRAHRLRRYVPDEPHAIHGNGWQRAWMVSARDEATATLQLDHDAGDDRSQEWPFPYRARQTIALTDDALTLTLDIENTGPTTFPYGLGWHPYFSRNARTELGFTARGVWHTDETRLPTRLNAARAAADFAIIHRIGETTLDHCFTGWTPPASLRWPERQMQATISADASCDHLVVFIPPGKDFLAVEPVTHMTDAFNRAGEDESGAAVTTGCRILAPGERFSCTMRISVSQIVAR